MIHNNIPHSGKLKLVFIVVTLFVIYFFLHIAKPLFAPDEARYVEIAREMIASGDFVSPKLDGIRYFEKPVLGYWTIALSLILFGINVFAARLPSILATLCMAYLTCLAVRKLRGGSKYGYLAAVIFLLMPLPFGLAGICILDALFSCLVTATVVSFFFAVKAMETENSEKKYYLMLVLTGICAGLAFLTKGFLAYALPVCAVLPWLIITKRWKFIFKTPWIPFIVSLFVIAPWAWLIHYQEADYWHYFVVVEHFQRFFGQEEAQHARSPFYFFGTLAWGTAAWLIFLPVLALGWKKVNVKTSGLIFLLSWAFGPFLFLSASSGKLDPYILPCFPPIAAIFALGFHRYFLVRNKRNNDDTLQPQYPPCKCLNIILTILLCLFIIALPVALWVLADLLPNFNPENNTLLARVMKEPVVIFEEYERWKFNLIALAGIFSIIALFCAVREKNPSEKFAFILLVYLPLFAIAYFIVPDSVYEYKCPMNFFSKCEQYIDDDTLLVSHGSSLLHGTCLYFRSTEVYPYRPGELEYGLSNYDDNKVYLVEWNGIPKFLREHPGKKVVLFSPYDRFLQYSDPKKYKEGDRLPEPDMLVLSSTYEKRDRFVMAIFYNGSELKQDAGKQASAPAANPQTDSNPAAGTPAQSPKG